MNGPLHPTTHKMIRVPRHIAALIRAHMGHMHVNQTEVGKWIGLTQPHIYAILNGQRGIAVIDLLTIANRLESQELRQYAVSLGAQQQRDFSVLMETLREALEAMPRQDQQELFLAAALLFEAKTDRRHSKVSELLRIFSNLISGDERTPQEG